MTIPVPFTPYVAATIPAKIVRTSNTTLFHIAARQSGAGNDALNWVSIAQLNGLVDPWVFGQAEIEIPPIFPTSTPTGLLLVAPGGATAGIAQT